AQPTTRLVVTRTCHHPSLTDTRERQVAQTTPYPLVGFFFFNAPATTQIYTLSLHDALPISVDRRSQRRVLARRPGAAVRAADHRSEEHTSELQSLRHLVCRLLLEKKKKTGHSRHTHSPTRSTL